MVDTYSVKTAEVHRLSGDMITHANKIRGALDGLEAKVQSLLGQWDGEAQGSYNAAQKTWDKAAAEMQQILNHIGTKTAEIADTYDSNDRRSAGRFQ